MIAPLRKRTFIVMGFVMKVLWQDHTFMNSYFVGTIEKCMMIFLIKTHIFQFSRVLSRVTSGHKNLMKGANRFFHSTAKIVPKKLGSPVL